RIEIERDPAQLHVDDVFSTDGALYGGGSDEPELQHLTCLCSDGISAVTATRGALGRPLDDDGNAGQRSVLFARHSTGNGLLLSECSRSNEEDSHQYGDDAFGHDDGLTGFWGRLLRSQDARPTKVEAQWERCSLNVATSQHSRLARSVGATPSFGSLGPCARRPGGFQVEPDHPQRVERDPAVRGGPMELRPGDAPRP